MLKLLTIILVLFCLNNLNAQINVSSTEACPTGIITFDYNTSSTLSNIQWVFDDGGTGSNNKESQHQYNSPGIYNVSFDANDGTNTIHEEITITIHPNPTCAFTHSTPITGCVPLTVSFSDASTGGGGSAITNWKWDFGDGGTIIEQQAPDYEYTIGGAFTVTLNIKDANGCINNCDFSEITVSKKPIPIITTDPHPSSACDPPLSILFDASSSQSNINTNTDLNYNWDFGTGNTSVNVSANETYTNYGEYPVLLTVTDAYSCSNDTTIVVRINSPTASFEVNDTVCLFVSFNNNSSIADYLWKYGDGSVGSFNQHTYNSSGTYTVTLIASLLGCSDTVSKDIYVEEVIADFYSSPDSLCDVFPEGNIIHYYNQSTPNATNFHWWLLNNDDVMYSGIGESYLENPTDTISFLDTTYSINGTRYGNICLKATSIHGCWDTICKTVYIKKPNALFMPDIIDGCAPLTVLFSDSSSALSDIIEYTWDFGDGTISSGTDENISHTFVNPGHYNVVLSITTDMGCQDTSYAITIDVGNHTHPDFDISSTSICPLDTVQFTDLTPATDSVNNWYFIADAGYMTSCYGNPNPTWTFQQEIGFVDLSMVSCNYGCCDTITKTDILEVKGPVCSIYNYKFECTNPLDYIFAAHVKNAETWQWDFGDGTIISGLTDLHDTVYFHHYDTTGNYTVVLTAFNTSTGCNPFIDTINVFIRDLKAKISSDTVFCLQQYVLFKADSSKDVYTNCHRGYYWDFGDGSRPERLTADSIYHNFPDTGSYDVMLIVKDINGCSDTTHFNSNPHAVYPGFILDPASGCSPAYTVHVTDTSTYGFGQANFNWSFGDGTFASAEDTTHEYIYNGTTSYHYITLTVTDSLGCSDSIMKLTTFSIPDTIFTFASNHNICVGDSVAFNPPNNIANYVWTFNETDTVETTNSGIFYHTFQNSGYFEVQLYVTDTNGCSAKYKFPYYDVSVQDYPIAGFYSEPDFNNDICYGEQIHFYDTSIVTNFYDRIWDLGDGFPIVPNDTVGKNYNIKGNYTISLIEVTTNGCADTVSYEINVVGPIAEFDFNPDNICKGQSIDFNTFNMEDSYYLYIDYGDGIVDSIDVDGLTDKAITHQYNYSPPLGYTTASVTFYSENMECSLTIDSIVHIYPVIADFKINNPTEDIDTLHCIGLQDVFYNNSINYDYWQWNLGDGTIVMDINTNHTYLQAGDYNVTLNILHYLTGCTDTISKTIHIKPKPEIQAFGGDTCVGAGITLYFNTPDTGLLYQWTPATGLDNPYSQSTTASPDVSTEYTVVAINQWNCSNVSSAYVNIQQEPENWIKDTTIIIGESLLMDGDQGNSFTYQWTPTDYLPCDTCPSPYFMPDDDIEYTLLIVDTMGCGFSSENIYTIEVLDVSSIDVPDVFTPNGDGDNDVIYVKGWGIKKLIEFSIYNRWGEKVFTTTDINKGWDGTYKGKKQNMDSYAYYVKAIVYIDDIPYEKKGTITLIR